jgi:hypothetical protein
MLTAVLLATMIWVWAKLTKNTRKNPFLRKRILARYLRIRVKKLLLAWMLAACAVAGASAQKPWTEQRGSIAIQSWMPVTVYVKAPGGAYAFNKYMTKGLLLDIARPGTYSVEIFAGEHQAGSSGDTLYAGKHLEVLPGHCTILLIRTDNRVMKIYKNDDDLPFPADDTMSYINLSERRRRIVLNGNLPGEWPAQPAGDGETAVYNGMALPVLGYAYLPGRNQMAVILPEEFIPEFVDGWLGDSFSQEILNGSLNIPAGRYAGMWKARYIWYNKSSRSQSVHIYTDAPWKE